MVHIDDLFAAFQRFQSKAIQIRTQSLRNPAEWNRAMAEAQQEFQAFCVEHNLPVDFTPR